VLVNWLGGRGENDVRMELNLLKQLSPKQSVYKNPKFDLPKRLWQKMCNMAEISEEKIFVELSNKQINVLTEYLVRCRFEISGKTTFKEEFVTCGGVDLNEIDASSMESKIVKGVFFAGEVINVDGVTGGYNFQAAWSTAWVVSESI
jgi:predicted Rossmann fold flavoprotein